MHKAHETQQTAKAGIRAASSILYVRSALKPFSQFDVGGEASFAFLPFEVSHRYQIDVLQMPSPPRRFIVSCAGHVHGYLPHIDQHRSGGYEVERSRTYMGLRQPIAIESRDIWPTG
jgi:hypothetical protein